MTICGDNLTIFPVFYIPANVYAWRMNESKWQIKQLNE